MLCEIKILRKIDVITKSYKDSSQAIVILVCYLEILSTMASALPSTPEKRKASAEQHSNGNPTKKNHWSAGLSTALDDESVRLHRDDLCTVIQDKFPKVRSAIFHSSFSRQSCSL